MTVNYKSLLSIILFVQHQARLDVRDNSFSSKFLRHLHKNRKHNPAWSSSEVGLVVCGCYPIGFSHIFVLKYKLPVDYPFLMCISKA